MNKETKRLTQTVLRVGTAKPVRHRVKSDSQGLMGQRVCSAARGIPQIFIESLLCTRHVYIWLEETSVNVCKLCES